MTKTIATEYSVFAGAVRSARRGLLSAGLTPPASEPRSSPRCALAPRHQPRHHAELSQARKRAMPKKPSTARAIARIYPYARPAMPRIILGMIAALAGALVSLVIPQVLRALVDGSLSDGDVTRNRTGRRARARARRARGGHGGAPALAGAHPGTHVEARMRNDFYAKLQDLPVAFHDRWPSGQLLSRMNSDLCLVRRWLSFGLVLLVINTVTIRVGFVFLLNISWILGLLFMVCSIPLWIYGFVFESKYSTVARRSQDQAGDLATTVEESVHGIRVLKAFGRGKHALRTSPSRPSSCAAPRSRRPRRSPESGSGCCWCQTSPSRCRCSAGCCSRRTACCRSASWSHSSPPRPCCAGRWSRSASCSR